MASVLVDKQIADTEVCARCVVHPLMYSERKKCLKDQAFQPKWDENDASVLRMNYCTKEFCLNHGEKLKMNGQAFVGLAYITSGQVEEINRWAEAAESKKKYDGENIDVNKTVAHVVYAPMHNGKYVDTTIAVYTEGEIDLPMHADLRYSKKLDEDVKTRVREFARQLMKKALFEHK